MTSDSPNMTRSGSFFAKTVLVLRYIAMRLTDSAMDNLEVIRREAVLFGGLALLLVGMFSFHAGRYCDGNTADYLSCTRPAVYYYYGIFEIALIVVGACCIAVWCVRPRRK